MKTTGIAAATAILALVLALPSPAQPVLDQSLTEPWNMGAGINACCSFIGQTYTAGATGMLAGVSINVDAYGSLPLHVAIRTVADGLPTTTILGDVTLGSSASGLSDLIVFPQAIPQVAGVKYAIVVDYPGAPPGQEQGLWRGATGDAYPRGDMVMSFDGGVSWVKIGPNNYDLHFKTFVNPPVFGVAIDIKPGSLTNPVNPRSKGTIPVAILSSSTFSAPDAVSRDSLTFGRTGAETSLAFCNTAAEDVNEDGIADLVCHFRTGQTDFRPGDTAGVLRGRTWEDTSICGTNPIRVVPRQ